MLPSRGFRSRTAQTCLREFSRPGASRRHTTAIRSTEQDDQQDHFLNSTNPINARRGVGNINGGNPRPLESNKISDLPGGDREDLSDRRWNSVNLNHESLISEIHKEFRAQAAGQDDYASREIQTFQYPRFFAGFSLLDDLLLMGKYPTKRTLESLLVLACYAHNDSRISQIQDLCKKRWIQLSSESIGLIAQHYCETGAPEQCKEFLSQKVRQGYDVPLRAWSALLRVLLEQRQTTEALQTLQEIEKLKSQGKNILPPRKDYYDALVCFANTPDAFALQWTWNLVKENKLLDDLDLGACTNILNVCAKAGLPVLATQVFKHFAEHGTSPRSHHYTALIESYCRAGDVKNAFIILELMREEQIDRTPTTAAGILEFMAPDLTLIDRAFATLQDLKAEGHTLDTSALNVVIDASVLRRDLSRAVATYQEHEALEVQPDIHTLNGLLAGCVGAFQKDLALSLIKVFSDKHKIQADARTFTNLISVCVLQEDYEDAFRYLEEMKEEGFQPPVEVYSLIIKRCVSLGDPRSKVAYDEMIGWGYRDHTIDDLLTDDRGTKTPSVNEAATGVFDKMRTMAESHRFFSPR